LYIVRAVPAVELRFSGQRGELLLFHVEAGLVQELKAGRYQEG